ncbi:hypothetical protein VULLAG_LOCUS6255 [Vulpes lagopus]
MASRGPAQPQGETKADAGAGGAASGQRAGPGAAGAGGRGLPPPSRGRCRGCALPGGPLLQPRGPPLPRLPRPVARRRLRALICASARAGGRGAAGGVRTRSCGRTARRLREAARGAPAGDRRPNKDPPELELEPELEPERSAGLRASPLPPPAPGSFPPSSSCCRWRPSRGCRWRLPGTPRRRAAVQTARGASPAACSVCRARCQGKDTCETFVPLAPHQRVPNHVPPRPCARSSLATPAPRVATVPHTGSRGSASKRSDLRAAGG